MRFATTQNDLVKAPERKDRVGRTLSDIKRERKTEGTPGVGGIFTPPPPEHRYEPTTAQLRVNNWVTESTSKKPVKPKSRNSDDSVLSVATTDSRSTASTVKPTKKKQRSKKLSTSQKSNDEKPMSERYKARQSRAEESHSRGHVRYAQPVGNSGGVSWNYGGSHPQWRPLN